jgi:serine/arginine repetitive matrix protein 2
VIAIIEEAVKSVNSLQDTALRSQHPEVGAKPSVPRTPPLKVVPIQTSNPPHSPTSQRISTSASSVAPPLSATTPLVQAESWRSKAAPVRPAPNEVPPKASVPTFLPPPLSALEQVESLGSNPEEELEVVDFSDMGRFVGVTDVPSSAQSSRPVASDFFDDTPDGRDPANTNIVAWRQRLSQDVLPERDGDVSIHLAGEKQSDPASDPLRTSEAISASTDHHAQAVTVPSQVVTQRTPRTQTFYKEATMSALDDVMSRIKGALDGMQASETTKEVPISSPESDSSTNKSSVPRSLGPSSSQKDRWIPPPLRLQNYDHELYEEPVTGFEPPRSPKPAWNAFVVRLPRSARALEPISRKQLQIFSKPVYQVRWDILSFNPPLEGTSRRDFALNDILFGKPARGYRGIPKYRVMLPRLGPRVNIPSHSLSQKSNGVGAFGRPGGADGVATWRKPASAKSQSGDAMTSETGLSTISRSPPPDTLSADPDVSAVPVSTSSESLKADGLATHMRSRLQPKMPAGSVVAFYRDSRIDAVEADLKPSVNFIVTSELEELRQTTPVKIKPSITVTSPSTVRPSNDAESVQSVKPVINGITSAENATPSLIPNKAESKSSEDSVSAIARCSILYKLAKLFSRLIVFQSLRLANIILRG